MFTSWSCTHISHLEMDGMLKAVRQWRSRGFRKKNMLSLLSMHFYCGMIMGLENAQKLPMMHSKYVA